jgi:hypothetical protein
MNPATRKIKPKCWGAFSKSANGIAGVRPSPGAATTKLQNRHQSSETVGCKFIAVAGDGHTPHFENKRQGFAQTRACMLAPSRLKVAP